MDDDLIIRLIARGVKNEMVRLKRVLPLLRNGVLPHFEGYRWNENSW